MSYVMVDWARTCSAAAVAVPGSAEDARATSSSSESLKTGMSKTSSSTATPRAAVNPVASIRTGTCGWMAPMTRARSHARTEVRVRGGSLWMGRKESVCRAADFWSNNPKSPRLRGGFEHRASNHLLGHTWMTYRASIDWVASTSTRDGRWWRCRPFARPSHLSCSSRSAVLTVARTHGAWLLL